MLPLTQTNLPVSIGKVNSGTVGLFQGLCYFNVNNKSTSVPIVSMKVPSVDLAEETATAMALVPTVRRYAG